MLFRLSGLVYGIVLSSFVTADIIDIIKTEIKLAITDTVGKKRAMYYGWHDSQGHSFSDAIGKRDWDQETNATVTDQIPMGSLAKSYVTTAVLSLLDQGVLNIDDTLVDHVDPWLKKYMNLSLSTIFPGENIGKVTIRELLHMSSGLNDYNDDVVWYLSTKFDYDLTPYMYLTTPEIFTPAWLFPPGEGLAYSSVGFELAGMVLASIADRPWYDVNVSKFFSPDFMEASQGFSMVGKGPCSEHVNTPHTYSFNRTLFNKSNPSDPYPSRIAKRSYFTDMNNHSCLNGWMCGNLIVAPWDLAYYMFSLFSPQATTPLISDNSLNQMMKWDVATAGFGTSINLTYGLGTMKMDLEMLFNQKEETPDEFRYWVGHAGQDYGSGGFGFYIPGIDGALSVMWNSDPGSKIEQITLFYSVCKIGEVVLNAFMPIGGPQLFCGESVEEFATLGFEMVVA